MRLTAACNQDKIADGHGSLDRCFQCGEGGQVKQQMPVWCFESSDHPLQLLIAERYKRRVGGAAWRSRRLSRTEKMEAMEAGGGEQIADSSASTKGFPQPLAFCIDIEKPGGTLSRGAAQVGIDKNDLPLFQRECLGEVCGDH